MTSPALAEVAADPDRLEQVPDEELPELLAEIERLRAEVWRSLTQPPQKYGSGAAMESGTEDQMIDVEAVAERLDVSERYVYDHADDWPFTRRISPRKLRFSEQGLYRWLETRR